MNQKNNEPKDTNTTIFAIPNFSPLAKTNFDNLKLNHLQKQILFGGLLGDVYSQLQNKGKNYRLRFQQKFPAHQDYILKLFYTFQDFCQSTPSIVNRKKNNTSDIRFQTTSHPEFNYFSQLFYGNDKKKILPSNQEINQWLTPLAFTYWYMDDGGIETSNPNACALNTQALEFDDVERLIIIINQKFDLEAYSRDNKNRKVIIVPARSCQKLTSLMIPNLVDCMKYKVPGEK